MESAAGPPYPEQELIFKRREKELNNAPACSICGGRSFNVSPGLIGLVIPLIRTITCNNCGHIDYFMTGVSDANENGGDSSISKK